MKQLPAFMAQLRQRDGVSAKALELLILSAARTGEIIGARWEEFDLDRGNVDGPGVANESWRRACCAVVA